jgi:glutathione peroxidase
LAFPCDQFLSQEPGTNADIKKLIRDKFKADFLIFEKSEINGPITCEVYKFLRNNATALYDPENEVVQEVPWNFSKFIVDGTTGQVVSYYNPRVSPLSLRAEI